MKKYSMYEISMIGLILLLICVVIALIGKHLLGLEGDYLSAAATLFAAVVAMLLFNDWREEYLIKKLEQFQFDIQKASSILSSKYKEIDNRILVGKLKISLNLTYDGEEISKDEVDEEFNTAYEDLYQYLPELHRLLTDYAFFLINLKSEDTAIHLEKVEEFRSTIFKLQMAFKIREGILSTKFLKVHTVNILIKECGLNDLPTDLKDFAFKDRTIFFYKIFNK